MKNEDQKIEDCNCHCHVDDVKCGCCCGACRADIRQCKHCTTLPKGAVWL